LVTSSLIPAFSPRRRRIVRRLLENSCDWIDRPVIRKIGINQQLFPLLSAFASGFGAIASKRSEDGGGEDKR
jgi:hypothetical protein